MTTRSSICAAAAMTLLAAQGAWATSPDVQTPAPVIYLADNLDEQDGLGYCIDTVGRGLSERLHAHSCKPRGGDVQFRLESDTGRIASAAFAGKCAELMAEPADRVTLALLDCSDSELQRFNYDETAMEIRPAGDGELCLVTGSSGRSAGPFMSRDLFLAACADTDAQLRQWIIVDDR